MEQNAANSQLMMTTADFLQIINSKFSAYYEMGFVLVSKASGRSTTENNGTQRSQV